MLWRELLRWRSSSVYIIWFFNIFHIVFHIGCKAVENRGGSYEDHIFESQCVSCGISTLQHAFRLDRGDPAS